MNNQEKIIAIVGPTACGKTHRAVELARALDGEIISGDSRQIYRGMDIGTGKDLGEYGPIPAHLLDIRPAGYRYNLHEYVDDFHHALADIRSRGKQPILCGGTGMYVETVLSGVRLPQVDPNPELREKLQGKSLEELTAILSQYKELHNTTDVDTCQRAIRAIEIEEHYRSHPDDLRASRRETATPLPAVIIGLDIDRDLRRQRISARLDARLQEGMLDEVQRLLDSGIAPDDLIYYGLEYKFVTLHLIGRLTFDEMRSQLETAIHQFAKRQMTWFRGMERRGFRIHWLPYDAPLADFLSLL